MLDTRPHDRTSFTQGFELVDGVLYEGTGMVGASAMLATDPRTGEARARVDLPVPFFGEGITVAGDRIWQLTWENGVAFERDRATLAERRQVRYEGEGWGICHDGERLLMSDGSDRLTVRDPASFDVLGEVRVTRDGEPVDNLNELECVDGAVWANVWQTDEIVRIDPASGTVTAVVDASGLLAGHAKPDDLGTADVLNGIAAVPGTDEFLITGKYWPLTFHVRFVP